MSRKKLTRTQIDCLAYIFHEGPTYAAYLAKVLRMSRGGIAASIHQLYDRRYLTMIQGQDENGQKKILDITVEGKKALSDALGSFSGRLA